MNDKNRDATCDTDIATQVSECTRIQKNENCIAKKPTRRYDENIALNAEVNPKPR
jgi:hypothetical protein